MSNTTSKALATLVAEAEAEGRRLAEASVSEMTAAVERLATIGEEAAAAADHVKAIDLSWAQLRDDFTSQDHAVALSEVQRAEARLRGATVLAEKATRNQLSTDAEVAEAVASVLREVLEVEAIPTFVEPAGRPHPNGLPAAVVVQNGETKWDKSGTISGNVEVIYYRKSEKLHNPLNADELRLDMIRPNLIVRQSIARTVTRDDVDRLKLQVLQAVPETPLIAEIKGHAIRALGNSVTAEVVSASRFHSEKPEMLSFDPAYYKTTRLGGSMVSEKLVSENISADGLRRVLVDVGFGFELGDQGASLDLKSLVDQAGKDLVGRFFGNLGTVTVVEPVAAPEARHALKVMDKLADRMRDAKAQGFEGTIAHTFGFRVTVDSRVPAEALAQVA